MPLKDLLISFSNGRTSDTVLKYGLALASNAKAELTAIHVTPPILEQNQIVTWMPENLLKQVCAANDDVPKRAEQALTDRMAALKPGTDVQWVSIKGNISERLAAAARTHDLLLIGKYSETTEEAGTHVRSEQIVTQSGRPLIVVPAGWQGCKTERIVVAWDGGSTAARALFDAIQLLPGIKEINVVSVAHSDDGTSPLNEVKRHIAAHNLDVATHILPPRGNIAAQILAHCYATSTDLLVVGSRGTTRLRDGLVHGGTGRSFFEKAEIPVFVSQ